VTEKTDQKPTPLREDSSLGEENQPQNHYTASPPYLGEAVSLYNIFLLVVKYS